LRAIDTNVLCRLLVRDDPSQAQAAEAFVANGAWVSLLVLAETTWVLESVYDLDAKAIQTALAMLCNHRHLTLQDTDTVEAAVASFAKRPAIGFSDCLIAEIARKAGHTPLGTFDRDLAKLPDVEHLQVKRPHKT
jgi:predicted nucleic-acid-binding protein